MSYISDKEKMKKDAKAHRERIFSIIKITFVVFAVSLLVFCVTLGLSMIFDWDTSAPSGDTTPPVIRQNFNLSGFEAFDGGVIGYIGDTPAFKRFVTVTDDTDDAPVISILEHNEDINKEGTYTVKYVAEDASGNSSYFTLKYVIKKQEYSYNTLMSLIEQKADDLGITKQMSKVEQVRKIYAYVNAKSTIYFTDESNIPNIDRNKWESDWLEEAVRGMETHEGDCYTYYSLSKAFFEYFGIENMGIKRAENYEGAEDDGTHFWSVVNIGENGANKWYYYDATRLSGYFNGDKSDHNACLITEEKLKSHRTSKGGDYFYKMTKGPGFPAISTEELD
jgi:hypothetical protein